MMINRHSLWMCADYVLREEVWYPSNDHADDLSFELQSSNTAFYRSQL